MEGNANSTKGTKEKDQPELNTDVEVTGGNTDGDPSQLSEKNQENTNTPNKNDTVEKKEKRITRLLTFWKKKEKPKDPNSEETGAATKNSPETERKRG